ncbi:Maf family protein [Candidatus Mycolicibacterium alkanivorans]|uniref:Nucleoside triphosphate pyrophosphatase n=1 Tax=Candidatus Mycolicibacterium alkanivorans TaxID=2954114 RepID=A0ABS9Z0H9_9MYCO|nr:nucleoside triphosphate pyrophosphatase [Candidatus Mycolicibacterium alkanivorans]MCI4676838.1 Maf-like protein [Candidatus Mycolicibacterium alkanivorans]
MTGTRVVLGSASSGRLRVLRSAGIDPLVVVSGVDEDAIVARLGSGADPADVVNALAQAKAEAVRAVLDDDVAADCVVIGCDSMLFVDGRLSGKPGTLEQAAQQWNSMAGRDGHLFTGHCVIRVVNGAAVQSRTRAAVTTVRFSTPNDTDLADYIASGEPLNVAGAFTLDGLGGWFVDGVDGDPSNVVGLGLALTHELFNAVGLSIGDLWAANPVR